MKKSLCAIVVAAMSAPALASITYLGSALSENFDTLSTTTVTAVFAATSCSQRSLAVSRRSKTRRKVAFCGKPNVSFKAVSWASSPQNSSA